MGLATVVAKRYDGRMFERTKSRLRQHLFREGDMLAGLNREVMPTLAELVKRFNSLSLLDPTDVKTAAYTASAYDLVVANPSGGAFSITLPVPVPGGQGVVDLGAGAPIAVITTSASNYVTLVPPAGVTINGQSTFRVQGAYATVALFPASSTQWVALGSVMPQGEDDGDILIWDGSNNVWIPGSVTPRYIDTTYSPVGLWWMGNVGGEDDAVPGAKDHSGNGFDLTVEAGGRRYMYIHPRVLGAYFDGQWNLYRASFESQLAITGDMTLMFTVLMDAGVAINECIVGHMGQDPGPESSPYNALYLCQTIASAVPVNGDWLEFVTESGAGVNSALDTPNRPVRGQIAQVVWTRQSNTVQLYLNGAVGAPSAVLTAPTDGSSGRLRVGGGAGFTRFHGNVSNLAIYNRALTAAEVAERFNWHLGPQFGYYII